jgi:hypothetical protein
MSEFTRGKGVTPLRALLRGLVERFDLTNRAQVGHPANLEELQSAILADSGGLAAGGELQVLIS